MLQSNSLSEAVRCDAEVGSTKVFAAETVIYATGRVPLQAEVDTLRFCASEFHQIGDCWVPRTVQQATRMALPWRGISSQG